MFKNPTHNFIAHELKKNMEEKIETKELEKELEAKVGDLVGQFSEQLGVILRSKSIIWKITWKLAKW